MTTANLERTIAERLVRAYFGDDIDDLDVAEEAAKDDWRATAREVIAMWQRFAWRHWESMAKSIMKTHFENHPDCHYCGPMVPAMDLSAAFVEEGG